jgi:4-oxalomesaconate tautomerase
MFEARVELEGGEVRRAGIVRTARKLMDGTVYPRSY